MTGPVENATILITGATAGIGRATTLGLAALGATLVLLARDRRRGEEIAALARESGASGAEVIDCDLSLLSSVREAAAEFRGGHERLDVLINDAAVFLGVFGDSSGVSKTGRFANIVRSTITSAAYSY